MKSKQLVLIGATMASIASAGVCAAGASSYEQVGPSSYTEKRTTSYAVGPSETTYSYSYSSSTPTSVSPGAVVYPGAVSPGAVSPGAVSPGAVSPGAVSPGAVSPGAVSPGAVSPSNFVVPEMDAASGAQALALLTGILILLGESARRRKNAPRV